MVYKIDRSSRSLANFAKLVDELEEADCSFVSVSQAFNTSSSMGRLTLNVLLSFALCDDHELLSKAAKHSEDLCPRSKSQFFSTGRVQSGWVMRQRQVHRILTNLVYLGKIRHKDQSFEGTPEAILDDALW